MSHHYQPVKVPYGMALQAQMDGSYYIVCAAKDILKLRDYFLEMASDLSTRFAELESPKPTVNTSISANEAMQKILEGIRQREVEIAASESVTEPIEESPTTEILVEDEQPTIDCMLCHGKGGKDGQSCTVCGIVGVINTSIETTGVSVDSKKTFDSGKREQGI